MKPIYRMFWELGVVLFVIAEAFRQIDILWGVGIPWLFTILIFGATVLILASWGWNFLTVIKPLRVSSVEISIDDFEVRRELAGGHPPFPGPLLKVTIVFVNRSSDSTVLLMPDLRIAFRESFMRNLRRQVGVSNFHQFWLTDNDNPISIPPGGFKKLQREQKLPLRDAPTKETVDLLNEIDNEFDSGHFSIEWREIGGRRGTYKPRRNNF